MKKEHFLLLIILSFSAFPAWSQPADYTGERPENIILLIGDGMGVAQIYAGLTVNGGHLNLEKFPVCGFSRTQSASDWVTDSGAGGTALATGHKTYNHAIGVDPDTVRVPSILELAEEHGKSTGLIATSEISHATPASFIAHVPNRKDQAAIARQFPGSGIDFFAGGGAKYIFEGENPPAQQLTMSGYSLLTDISQLDTLTTLPAGLLAWPNKPPSVLKGRGDYLPSVTQKALELLSGNPKGFFIMIEGSQIDWGGHDNDIDYVTSEMIDFDQAVGKALAFAEKNGKTLVIVTADHETGGLALPEGDFEAKTVKGKFTTGGHTGVMVPVFAFGPGAGIFGGIQENTVIFEKMKFLFGF
ncbi:MAG: alkaline phosphatase [Bacteroidales bacterium]